MGIAQAPETALARCNSGGREVKCMKQKGFTLSELLIVIVILGVMGSVALPRYYKQKEKAVVAEAVSILSAIRQGEISYNLENNSYKILNSSSSSSDDWGMIGMDAPSTTRFYYTVNSSGTATATRVNSPQYAGQTISLLVSGTWTSAGNPHPFTPQNSV